MKFFSSFSILSSDNESLRQFLAYLPAVNGDLSTISAPTPLLAPKSVVEYPALVALHHPLFLLPTFQQSPLDRSVSILKNYLVTLRAQANGCHESHSDESKGVKKGLKKPLNSFLGELYLAAAKSGDGSGETEIICEQVSHHPPVTASYIQNKSTGISVQAYLGQLSNFIPTSGSITIAQNGHALTHIERFDEDHLTTFPTLRIRGLLSLGGNNRYTEYTGTCWIVSSTGLVTKIVFEEEQSSGGIKSTLGFGGTSLDKKSLERRVTATISRWHEGADGRPRTDDEPLVALSGSWDGVLNISNRVTGQEEAFDTSRVSQTELFTPPPERQNAWYSQKAWAATKEALIKSDWKKAADEKRKVEEWQRELRRSEEREGREWRPKYFGVTEKCERFDTLARVFGTESGQKVGNTVWRHVKTN